MIPARICSSITPRSRAAASSRSTRARRSASTRRKAPRVPPRQTSPPSSGGRQQAKDHDGEAEPRAQAPRKARGEAGQEGSAEEGRGRGGPARRRGSGRRRGPGSRRRVGHARTVLQENVENLREAPELFNKAGQPIWERVDRDPGVFQPRLPGAQKPLRGKDGVTKWLSDF